MTLNRIGPWLLVVIACGGMAYGLLDEREITVHDGDGRPTSFHELYREQGLVMLLLSSEKACGCKVSSLTADLQAVYADERPFITAICGESNEKAAALLQEQGGNLPQPIYFEPARKLIERYRLSGEANLVFLDETGRMIGAMPAGLDDKAAVRVAHQLINR